MRDMEGGIQENINNYDEHGKCVKLSSLIKQIERKIFRCLFNANMKELMKYDMLSQSIVQWDNKDWQII